MPKIPIVSAHKLIKVLKKKGFTLDHVSGSHHIFYHPEGKLRASVPVHKGRDLGKGITLSILKDAKITPEEFTKLLSN
ncbi:hypothetical protein A3D84_04665 [Candidatus Woesebacteria bacterium RIFCSPHIGHO2_02_FULL_42_20]|uniref:Addiction module toxin, HicA family n=1 Tax=Candidatus Woesebacteria bacterium RIFCSPHIGHO2_12_FULL_41_24 TaxID=1802510 RepID=A0A1F8AV05_9BACT|nr:MAG: hypothetical protein A2W15_00225 [Candidatus Woesebacteria bacterium RBG_16_41_13]OGM30998.1 MAG: hypothetical protein A2873_01855 [Candidatus Woesebacteria bacterium RIFCSPHIGHO2_01_FULL_42_80]OGM34472.1 MAG: hypothetical protein A3D84_04665 [Candidatus Woesebacteria bacterium RIFCSPHIGHO2_02_FULL_42_20]OGM55556.1 MAG: hypothetical protein A3E44_04805 [Candidatus Woesebacteria bacterium RIFCSPHIGHO2_12_FULL_41_24]OGM67367.1 MAG: hypothetical protein A2969_02910 [Candidatus Woesebacteri